MAIRVITDSSADFDAAVAKRRKIDIVPMTIQFGSASFVAGKTISNDVFYQLLQESKTFPSTSQPTPAAFLRYFEEAKASGDQAVVVLLSGALSGTLQSAEIAKEMCGYEPIYIVDSRSATAGIQILVNLACKLRDSGLPAAAIAEEVERLKDKVRIFAVIDTLEYLRRGQLQVIPLEKNFTWLDAGTADSLLTAGETIKRIQDTTGRYVGCLEELALYEGWITEEQVHKIGDELSMTLYGKYLQCL